MSFNAIEGMSDEEEGVANADDKGAGVEDMEVEDRVKSVVRGKGSKMDEEAEEDDDEGEVEEFRAEVEEIGEEVWEIEEGAIAFFGRKRIKPVVSIPGK